MTLMLWPDDLDFCENQWEDFWPTQTKHEEFPLFFFCVLFGKF